MGASIFEGSIFSCRLSGYSNALAPHTTEGAALERGNRYIRYSVIDKLPGRHVCTLEMNRLRFPRLPDRTLETVYLHLFQEAAFIRQNHRTLDDARMTAKIWLKLEGE